MTDREKQELEIKTQVFDAVLDGVRTGHIQHPALVLQELTTEAIRQLVGPAEAQ